jgi:hypothetical protein
VNKNTIYHNYILLRLKYDSCFGLTAIIRSYVKTTESKIIKIVGAYHTGSRAVYGVTYDLMMAL